MLRVDSAMTRVCMDCEKTLGEKCPGCGEEATKVTDSNNAKHFYFFCENMNCYKILFQRGEGGTTTGLCSECAEKRRVTAVQE